VPEIPVRRQTHPELWRSLEDASEAKCGIRSYPAPPPDDLVETVSRNPRALLQGGELTLLDESYAALDRDNLRQALTCARERANLGFFGVETKPGPDLGHNALRDALR
jgi:hypothetical protein